ncbi:MAG: cysteine--tRNA ligase [Rhodothermales bacterium]|nr:cysteine--tRNA ligase [Rhodothermales bacterium]
MSSLPPFQLFNTLSGKVESLAPLEPNHLRMYNCGPTVYSYAHIGNFRTFLTSDLIVRVAQAIAWKTSYVSNITDVGHLTEDDFADASGEDKMARALRSKEGERFANVWDLARYYTESLLTDWSLLNLRPPDVRPRATEHVTQQIEAIEQLIARGHAYETDSGVYFSVSSFPDYGKLSGNNSADQLENAVRDVVVDGNKRDPRDFALWKKDDKHLMQWFSPFGRGFPGWHIECSVMSMQYLGPHLDLHAGGEDLIFPHHECEIAQSEGLTDQPFASIWTHTRFLHVEGEKMSKSKGNFYTVRDLTAPESEGGKGIDPLALRLALISGQYRKPFNFTFKNLNDCLRIVDRYRDALALADRAIADGKAGEDLLGHPLDVVFKETLFALLDDLNTPEALAASLEGVKLINGTKALNAASGRSARAWIERVNDLLGIVWHEDATVMPAVAEPATDSLADRVESLLKERTAARRNRDFARADAIRAELDELNIDVMDSPEGSTWRRKR